MINKTTIRSWNGKIIGFIEEDSVSGDKTVKDFYGRILGKYNKKLNVTKDFYGRLVAKGDQTGLLFKDK
jgi:hypothetical protein